MVRGVVPRITVRVPSAVKWKSEVGDVVTWKSSYGEWCRATHNSACTECSDVESWRSRCCDLEVVV